MLKDDNQFSTEAFHTVFQQIIKAVKKVEQNKLQCHSST